MSDLSNWQQRPESKEWHMDYWRDRAVAAEKHASELRAEVERLAAALDSWGISQKNSNDEILRLDAALATAEAEIDRLRAEVDWREDERRTALIEVERLTREYDARHAEQEHLAAELDKWQEWQEALGYSQQKTDEARVDAERLAEALIAIFALTHWTTNTKGKARKALAAHEEQVGDKPSETLGGVPYKHLYRPLESYE